MTPIDIQRREFLKKIAILSAGAPLLTSEAIASTNSLPTEMPPIHIFSKHLQFLNYDDMADVAKSLGFAGVDLTIRPDGHVEPTRVVDDLPKAVEALKKVDLAPSLFCTSVESAANPIDVKLLRTASELGFKYYRMAWYKYPNDQSIPLSLAGYSEKVVGLSKLNKKLNLVGCYQNHAGRLVGASLWEVYEMLKRTDPKHMGAQYDIRHAVVEGGMSWQTGLNLILPNIKTLVLKDTQWVKKNGKWILENVPLGEGMVDYPTYFKIIKAAKLNVPICLHLEYPIGGAENGAKTLKVSKETVFEAMKRDLAKAKELWMKA